MRRVLPKFDFQPTKYGFPTEQTRSQKTRIEAPRRHQSSDASSLKLEDSMHFNTERLSEELSPQRLMRTKKLSDTMPPPKYKENSTLKITTHLSMSEILDSETNSVSRKQISVRSVIHKRKSRGGGGVSKSHTRRSTHQQFELSEGDKSMLHDLQICSLCVEEFETGQELSVLKPCFHNFHKRCLHEYFKWKKELRCPICKRDLFETRYF